MIELECKIIGITFTNEVTGYAVLTAVDKDSGKSFTLVFKNGMISPKIGFSLIVQGDWVNHPQYGKQFMATQYQEVQPSDEEGIVAYLSCGIFKGIREKMARKIVDVLGKETFDVIENHPERLKEVKGLGESKIETLIKGFIEHKQVQEIVMFFSQFAITTNMIMKIYRQYGKDAIEIVKENPYRLCYDIDGIGFKRADDVALKIGVEKYDENRIMTGINYILTEAGEEGHTFMYKQPLIDSAIELLGIEGEKIAEMIDFMIKYDEAKTVTGKEVFCNSLYYAEKNISSKLLRLNAYKPYVSSINPVSIENIEKEIGITYNEKQKEAINTVINHNVMVLTGGPGTGKTTALLGIIKTLKSMDLTIACAAPTGRAAKRMSEVTEMNATTIHRLLEYNPEQGYKKNEDNPLYHDVIVVDEVSMVNVLLMSNLLKAVKSSSKLILVGDENQLPAIGPGNILHDIIESGVIPVITLTEIFRQAEGSKIILNAHNIINNRPINLKNSEPGTDFFFLQESNPDKVDELINNLVIARLPAKYSVKPTDIQVLSPRRKDIKCSANDLNEILQKTINKNDLGIQSGAITFKLGDKVMQIKNDYDKDVFNGDVGYITEVDVEDKSLTVTFDDDFEVKYPSYDFDELVLAYASTIHKSQGSEYPIVIIPMLKSFSIMLKRNLIYTGITRAKNLCIIVGELSAFARAINDTSYEKRNTMLEDWLKEQ